jgi:hypothetical protein
MWAIVYSKLTDCFSSSNRDIFDHNTIAALAISKDAVASVMANCTLRLKDGLREEYPRCFENDTDEERFQVEQEDFKTTISLLVGGGYIKRFEFIARPFEKDDRYNMGSTFPISDLEQLCAKLGVVDEFQSLDRAALKSEDIWPLLFNQFDSPDSDWVTTLREKIVKLGKRVNIWISQEVHYVGFGGYSSKDMIFGISLDMKTANQKCCRRTRSNAADAGNGIPFDYQRGKVYIKTELIGGGREDDCCINWSVIGNDLKV